VVRFDPVLAEMRFGNGLSPVVSPPATVAQMLARLAGPDHAAARFPVETFTQYRARLIRVQDAWKVRQQERGSDDAGFARKAVNLEKKAARGDRLVWLGQQVQRRVWTEDGLRERLVGFWADHFTAQGKAGLLRWAATPYVEETIRPHVTGRFADLLIAATTSPLMLHYLDQYRSYGPNSPRAAQRGGRDGLNENLAREVLELHTLGVGAPYDQDDVRALALLLTGLSYQPEQGFVFRKPMAEPGRHAVLGVSYGGAQARLQDIEAALRDLARHPATARHLAQKLAVHFVADNPPADLVATLAARYLATDGDLMQVTEALLTHPAAWDAQLHNVRPPFDLMAAAARALAVPPDRFADQPEAALARLLRRPLEEMGQPWESPPGPDGWPEADASWITPQGLAGRLRWALTWPAAVMPDLPDPRAFATVALGDRLPEAVRFAAMAAENRAEGLGLILASPAFQRR
jgi:uncharacterized protein (DUF1800 family)